MMLFLIMCWRFFDLKNVEFYLTRSLPTTYIYIGAFHRLTANLYLIGSFISVKLFDSILQNIKLCKMRYFKSFLPRDFLKILTKFLVSQNENKRQIAKEKMIY